MRGADGIRHVRRGDYLVLCTLGELALFIEWESVGTLLSEAGVELRNKRAGGRRRRALGCAAPLLLLAALATPWSETSALRSTLLP